MRHPARRAPALIASLALLALAPLLTAQAPAPPRAPAAGVGEVASAVVDGFREHPDAGAAGLAADLQGRVDGLLAEVDGLVGAAEDALAASPAGELLDRLGVRAALGVRAPIPFTSVAFEVPDGAAGVYFRTKGPDGWRAWDFLAALGPEDLPGAGLPDAAAAVEGTFTELAWVGEATHLEIATPDAVDPAAVTGHLADAVGLVGDARSAADAALAAPGRLAGEAVEGVAGALSGLLGAADGVAPAPERARPRVLRRDDWGANEAYRSGSPRTADVRQGVVHHTATSNDYTRAEAPAVVRSIYHYHTQVLGWSDIGYNLLVDRFGRVYEGRAGGLEAGVVGAHARGHNTGSFGVAVIGNHDRRAPSRAAVEALTDVVAWQLDAHGINGSRSSALVGHRDVGSTACPGRHLYPRLDEIRRAAA